jgi:hypothetical protein
MQKMKRILIGIFILYFKCAAAQDSTAAVALSGYVETYYQYDFNKPADHNRPSFIYSHNRHDEFNLNLGFIKAAYTAQRVRANIAIGTGTYMNANYAAEPGVLKNIFEANAGIKVSHQKDLWIDAGIFSSHIGFESAISKDCWNLTRSILADNSPYFESGAKMTYTTSNNKWLLSALALNGWQRITKVSGNSLMSWGAQIQFRPSAKVLWNYSNFIGTDKPDSVRLSRFFHNLYGQYAITNKIGIITGFDIGTEEKSKHSNKKNTWYGVAMIIKYTINPAWSVAGRCEYYHDKYGVIISSNTPGGFQTAGYSFNIDYSPVKNVSARLEARTFSSKDALFTKAGLDPVKHDTFFTSSIAVSF